MEERSRSLNISLVRVSKRETGENQGKVVSEEVRKLKFSPDLKKDIKFFQ